MIPRYKLVKSYVGDNIPLFEPIRFIIALANQRYRLQAAILKPGVLCNSRKLLHELVTSLARGVLLTHEKLIREQKSSLTQNQALQIMFDLKFMTSVFMGRGEDDASEFSNRREQVLDALESCVDPFDLDVFTPYIATNLNRQLQRCGVCVEIQTICGFSISNQLLWDKTVLFINYRDDRRYEPKFFVQFLW